MKQMGLGIKKKYEKKKRLLANEVISTAINSVNIEAMLRKTETIEKDVNNDMTYDNVHALMQLYQKVSLLPHPHPFPHRSWNTTPLKTVHYSWII